MSEDGAAGSSSRSTHSGDGLDARYTDAQDQHYEETNLDEDYIKGVGLKDIPGADSNPDKDDNSESSTDEYDGEEEKEDEEDEDQAEEVAPKQKKSRKPRKPNSIGTDRLVVHRVNSTGEPISPKKPMSHYGNAIGVILREVCSINETNLRDVDKENLRDVLLRRLHTRFKFPNEYDNLHQKNNQVNNHTIHKFSKT